MFTKAGNEIFLRKISQFLFIRITCKIVEDDHHNLRSVAPFALRNMKTSNNLGSSPGILQQNTKKLKNASSIKFLQDNAKI